MLDIQNGDELQVADERLIVRAVEKWHIASAPFLGQMTERLSIYRAPQVVNGKRGAATLVQSDIASTPILPTTGQIEQRPEMRTPLVPLELFLDGTDMVVRVGVERTNLQG